jgi:hypothetical protein
LAARYGMTAPPTWPVAPIMTIFGLMSVICNRCGFWCECSISDGLRTIVA